MYPTIMPVTKDKEPEVRYGPNQMETDLQRDIHAAVCALREVPYIRNTQLETHDRLSAILGGNVLVKREDRQPGGAYKVLGGANVIRQLSNEERKLGTVLASAGNHAIGVGAACGHFRVRCHMVIPRGTPEVKKEKIRKFGKGMVEFEEYGDSFDEANELATSIAIRDGKPYVHPFDDLRTIAGQGVMSAHMYAMTPGHIDRVYVALGGGGAVSALSEWTNLVSPRTEIYGVEPAEAAAMRASLDADTRVTLTNMSTFIDGAAVKTPGQHTFDIVRKNNVNVVTVTEQEACQALVDLLDCDGMEVELAAALPFARILKDRKQLRGKTVAVLVTGKNIDPSKLEIVRKMAS